MGIAATQDTSLSYKQGYITANEALSIGIHVIFAPVMDINNNPENPIINFRAYSDNPKVVSAFGNAFIPVITVIGLGFGNLLGGAVLVETIFSWPGIGMYAYRSAVSLDYPAITGVALLIAVNYVIINLIVDILYGIIDPRIRYQ